MISVVLTIFGLIFDIGGVIILYFFGPPIPTIFSDGSEVVSYTNDAEKEKKANIAKLNISVSRWALLMIIFGFLLQLSGQLVGLFTFKGCH